MESKLFFTQEQLKNSPSRKVGIDEKTELSYRQQAANFIQDVGQKLKVSQLCINDAVVYMHRFFAFHSFSEVQKYSLCTAALFLAIKVEEQARRQEHIIKASHAVLHKDAPPLDVRTDKLQKSCCHDWCQISIIVGKKIKAYLEKQFALVGYENAILQTLGFLGLLVEHPHIHVIKTCNLLKTSKDIAHVAYLLASASLTLTTMCLRYQPTLVACVCIHIACEWSAWKIELCSEGEEWYTIGDETATLGLIESLAQEFLAILNASPDNFRRRFMLGQKKSSCLGAVAGKVGFPSDVKKEQVTNMCVEELRMPTEPKQPISLDACQQKREERKVLPTPLPPFATQPQALVSKEVSGQCFATTIKESNQELQTKQNVNEMAKPILVKIPRNLITRLPQNHPQQLSKHSPIWVNISKDLISHLPEPKAQVTENQTSLKSFHDKMNGSCKRTHSLEEGEIYREGSAKKFRPDPSHKQDPLYKNENTPPEELTLDSRMRCH